MITNRQGPKNPSLREAEGYLDLIVWPSSTMRLSREMRVPLAERAIAALDRSGELGSWSSHGLFLRGQALRTMERYQEAAQAFQASAERAPENHHIALALAWCYKRCNRFDLAIESLERSLDEAQDVAIIHYNLACYLSLAHEVRRAIGHLSRAFELDPNYRDSAFTEPDFDPIRSHPLFQSILTVIV